MTRTKELGLEIRTMSAYLIPSAPVPDYRAYIILARDKRKLAHEFAATDRREAAWTAAKLVGRHSMEMWEGDEYVGTFTPGNPGCAPIFKRPPKASR